MTVTSSGLSERIMVLPLMAILQVEFLQVGIGRIYLILRSYCTKQVVPRYLLDLLGVKFHISGYHLT